MNSQAKEVTSKLNSKFNVLKYILSLVLISAGIVAFYQFSDYSQLYRVLGMVAVVIVALAIMLTTVAGRHSWIFAQEARQEIRKVVWPTRPETMKTTLMVFVMVIIVGFIIWLLDTFLFWAITSLTAQGV